MTSHAILGAGGVGGFAGAILSAAGEPVTLLLRAESLAGYPAMRTLGAPSGTDDSVGRASAHDRVDISGDDEANHLDAAIGAGAGPRLPGVVR